MKSKQKSSICSRVLYVSASIIAILGVTLLISNVLLYRTNVAQYVAQGNAISAVTAQLIPSQLLPGIFEPISIYWGIALLLTFAGILNQKVSKCLSALTENKACDTAVKTIGNIFIDDEIQSPKDKKAIGECNVAINGNK
jgi:hypothetical protein